MFHLVSCEKTRNSSSHTGRGVLYSLLRLRNTIISMRSLLLSHNYPANLLALFPVHNGAEGLIPA